MRFLRVLLIALLVASVLLVVSRGSWEARLERSNRAFIINLSVGPIWQPPSIPSYDKFKNAFEDLPIAMPADSVIKRVFRFDTAVFELICFAALSASICGVLYLGLRKGSSDIFLHYALFMAVGVAGAAVFCFVLWSVIGGWGPPVPLLFGFLGICFGTFIAQKRWRQN